MNQIQLFVEYWSLKISVLSHLNATLVHEYGSEIPHAELVCMMEDFSVYSALLRECVDELCNRLGGTGELLESIRPDAEKLRRDQLKDLGFF